MLFAKNKEYTKCYQVREEYKKVSGNVVRANYAYMKTLLDHISKDAPIYVYASDYDEFPELYQQLEVIKHLKAGDINGARKFWKKLSTHNPSLYLNDFDFTGDYTLFAQGLKRYLAHTEKVEIDQTEIDKLRAPMEKLSFIFLTASRPLRHEELISIIWKEEFTDAAMARIRKLISRYNLKNSVKIIASQGTYQLDKPTQISA